MQSAAETVWMGGAASVQGPDVRERRGTTHPDNGSTLPGQRVP